MHLDDPRRDAVRSCCLQWAGWVLLASFTGSAAAAEPLTLAALAQSTPPAVDPHEEKDPASFGLTWFHPLKAPEPSLKPMCDVLPLYQRDHVYLFLINGVDPYCFGNLDGLGDYVKSLGFANAYFGQMYHTRYFYHKIRAIKHYDHDARIAICGFSMGATFANILTHWLKEDGITVNLLFYLGGDLIFNDEDARPDNVLRIVNITGHGTLLVGGNLFVPRLRLDGAENMHIEARHMCLPSQAATLETLVHELMAVASAPPCVESAPKDQEAAK
jgi:hypothetical protein